MFYRDFTLTVHPDEVRFFMNQLIILLHEAHHRFPVALDLPEWQTGLPNPPDTLGLPLNYAYPGRVLRLFATNSAVLDSAVATLGISVLMDNGVLTSTPTLAATATEDLVACYRWRDEEQIARKIKSLGKTRQNPPERTPEFIQQARASLLAQLAAVRADSPNVLYVPLTSTHRAVRNPEGRMSLCIQRIYSHPASDAQAALSTELRVGSYGVSRKSELVWLPLLS